MAYFLTTPTLVSTEQWTLRLCGQKLELAVGDWRMAGHMEVHLGQWTHVAVTWDGRQFALFVNGIPQMTGAAGVDPLTGTLLPKMPVTIHPAPPVAPAGTVSTLTLGQCVGAQSLGTNFVGAIGGLALEQRAWSPDEVAGEAFAHEAAARELAQRYSVLTDPVAAFPAAPR